MVRRPPGPDPPQGRRIPPGGPWTSAPGGGNTAVLRELGWQVAALEYSPAAAALCAARGSPRRPRRRPPLPFPDEHFDLVMSTDLWEHIEDHRTVAREALRVLRPGGVLLLAVPSGMDLWSGHDVALGHVRRYEREQLVDLVTGAGLDLVDVVVERAAAAGGPGPPPPPGQVRERDGAGEPGAQHRPAGGCRPGTVLPVRRLPGVSLVLRALKP